MAVGPGELLATAGRPGRQYLVVVEGSIEARGQKGERRLRAGDTSGWQEMWVGGLSPETLVTRTAARLLVVGRAQFRAFAAIAGARPQPEADRVRRGPDLDLTA